MVVNQVNKGVKLIQHQTIDEIIILLESLKVDETVIDKVDALKTNKKSTSKRSAPKVPFEKQCSSNTKKGEKCVVAICDKSLGLCWAHMSKSQKDAYRKNKKIIF